MNPFYKFVYKNGKLIGITCMMVGILGALSGVSAYVVGAIPGLLFAWLGWKLYKITSKQEILSQNSEMEGKEKPSRFVNGFLAVFVSGFVIAGLAFAVLMVLLVYAFFQYKP